MSAIAVPSDELLVIHENQLEKDCQDNPRLAFLWGKALARANRKVMALKNNVKLRSAQIVLLIQQDPKQFGLEKVTEKTMDAVIQTDEQYMEFQAQLLSAQHEADVLQAFVYALNDRKSQIENMVRLHGQSYWSKPNLSHEEIQDSNVQSQTRSQARSTARLNQSMMKPRQRGDK